MEYIDQLKQLANENRKRIINMMEHTVIKKKKLDLYQQILVKK